MNSKRGSYTASQSLTEQKIDIVKNGFYQHYKGKLYEVLGEATHSETLEEMVVYRALYGNFGLWVRPKKMFLENVSCNGKEVLRFCYLGEDALPQGR